VSCSAKPAISPHRRDWRASRRCDTRPSTLDARRGVVLEVEGLAGAVTFGPCRVGFRFTAPRPAFRFAQRLLRRLDRQRVVDRPGVIGRPFKRTAAERDDSDRYGEDAPAAKHTNPRRMSCIMVSFEPTSQAGQSRSDNADQESGGSRDLYLRPRATCHLKRTYPIIGLTKQSGSRPWLEVSSPGLAGRVVQPHCQPA